MRRSAIKMASVIVIFTLCFGVSFGYASSPSLLQDVADFERVLSEGTQSKAGHPVFLADLERVLLELTNVAHGVERIMAQQNQKPPVSFETSLAEFEAKINQGKQERLGHPDFLKDMERIVAELRVLLAQADTSGEQQMASHPLAEPMSGQQTEPNPLGEPEIKPPAEMPNESNVDIFAGLELESDGLLGLLVPVVIGLLGSSKTNTNEEEAMASLETVQNEQELIAALQNMGVNWSDLTEEEKQMLRERYLEK